MSSSLALEVIISTLLGGGVGWVTNAFAINMLFKKYWKWGGVIEENYGEFITNMSQLVEDDLVNGKTLATEFNAPPFKHVLQKWIEDIIMKELPKNSGEFRFEELPGIESSAVKLISLIEQIEPSLIQGVYEGLSTKKIKALLSKEHYNYIIDTNIRSIFAQPDTYQYGIQNALSSFLEGKVVKTLISERAIRQIGENIGDVIQKIDFSRYDGNMETAYHKLLDAIEIDRLISDLQQSLGEMRFKEFVKNPKNFSRELVTRLVEFAASPQGQELLEEVIKDFLDLARRIDLRIGDVVNSSVKDGIRRFCKDKMPGIINKIADFIQRSQSEIETIVNDTVDRQLDKSIGGKIGKFFKDIFTDNLAGKARVIEKITIEVKKYGDKAGEELSRRILDMIDSKTIGEIIALAQNEGFINVKMIVDIVNLNLKDLSKKDIPVIDDLLETQIGNSFGNINLSVIKTTLLPKLFDKVKQEYLYDDKFKRDARAGITAKFSELANKMVSDFFNVNDIKISLQADKIKNTVLNFWNTLSEMKISEFMGSSVPKQVRVKRETFENLWEKYRDRELNQLYSAIQNDTVYTKVAEGLIEIVNQNLDTFLTGNVSALVKTELEKLQPPEVNTMVQDFMGKEMKSINILGAILGALIGGVSAWGASFAGLPSQFILWMLAAYGVIFAGVGIGTNWLAIKMLFRPYMPMFSGAKFPPFVGIVAARKPEFAKNISGFVKQRMLGNDALKNYFVKNKDMIKDKSGQWISDTNYAAIDMIFADKDRLDNITNFIFSAVQTYISEHKEELANAMGGFIKQLVDDGKVFDLIPALRDIIVKKLKESDLAPLIQRLIEKEIDGKNLGHYKKAIENFTDLQLKKLFETVARDLTRDITLENVKRLIAEQNEQFIRYIEQNTVQNLAGTKVMRDITDKVSENVGPMLHKAIGPIVDKLEKQEFNPSIQLKDLFHGAIPGLIEKNVGFIIDMLFSDTGRTEAEVTEQIASNLPLLAKPWSGHVAPIVKDLFRNEMPEFLHRKQGELLSIANTLLENRLSNLGFNERSLEKETIERTVAAILDSPSVQKGVVSFVTIIIRQLSELPLKTLLNLIAISSINDITRIVEPLLKTTLEHVKENISREEIIDIIVGLVKTLLMDILDSIAVADLLKDIELEKELRKLVTQLINDQQVIAEVSSMLDEALYVIQRDPDFYNDSILRQDLAAFIGALKEDRGWELVRQGALPAFKEFLLKLSTAISTETKRAICLDYLIPAVVDSCEYNFSNMIQAIDVQVVVEREINAMHPKGIEDLFNKFAGTYFKKITFYGWIGVFGGIASYIISFLIAKK